MTDKKQSWFFYFSPLPKTFRTVHPWVDDDGILHLGPKPDPAFDKFMQKVVTPIPEATPDFVGYIERFPK